MKNRVLTIHDTCHVGIFVAIIAACSLISIPTFIGVPMTLQTFAIPLAGVVLGVKKGMLATVVYILLGAVGVPIFANFTGGIGVIFGRTGGFILSFPLMALAAGIGALKGKIWLTTWLVVGAVVNYFCGLLMFSYITSIGWAAAFPLVVVPFLPADALKIVMVVVLGPIIKYALVKNGLLTAPRRIS